MKSLSLRQALALVVGLAATFLLGYVVGGIRPPASGLAPQTPDKLTAGERPPRLSAPARAPERPTAEELREYLGFPPETSETTSAESVKRLVEAGARKAIGEFIAVWKDPNPAKGHTFDIEQAQGALQVRLAYLGNHDYRARGIAAELKRKIEDPGLSTQLRAVLYDILIKFRPRGEMRYFKNLAQSGKDPWLRSMALSYLAGNRDVPALIAEVRNAQEAKSTDEQLRALGSIAAYFGEDVELEVPSKHWGVLVSNHPSAEEAQRLAEDVQAWWQAHGPEYTRGGS